MIGSECPFCSPAAESIFHAGALTLGLWDAFPVSPGHVLLVPKRHIASWFEATKDEQAELLAAFDIAHAEIAKRYPADGVNIGINVGAAAGQTVEHLHVHVIPRRQGDVSDPRGGVRHVIQARGNYLAPNEATGPLAGASIAADAARTPNGLAESGILADGPHRRPLVTGDHDDPLLPHLVGHIKHASAFDIAVAFILPSGVARIREHLRDLLNWGGSVRLLAGDYFDVTDPGALRRLLDLVEETKARGRLELRIFESSTQAFHPKVYIFHSPAGESVAYVGSSNLSKSALEEGIEWNYRVVPSADRGGFDAIAQSFERLFRHPKTCALDHAWLDAYERRRRPVEDRRSTDVQPEPPESVPEPHEIQREALAALANTRAEGNRAGLVVLATGLGKTWLAAFDTVTRPEEFRRILFVAHREEILTQAMETFRRIRPTAHLGLYTGQEKTPDAEIVFASVRTLGRSRHLDAFDEAAFDYIVVDEFHHAAAVTYRRILDHFDPRFLLGLTATPERTDGGDLLALCGENLVYRRDLAEGIRRELLAPFRYFGVPDDVDYQNIPWRSTRFDEQALENALATQTRAQNALEQWREKVGPRSRTLAFCCSKRHADFMAAYFRDAGLRVASVHSGDGSDPRTASLEALRSGELDVVFAVDMFNEGVDLPNVDAIMMLRPTESRILWLQQFGRGLRRSEGKAHVTVVDYIGNHRTFLTKPQALLALGASHAELAHALDQLQAGELELPPGCEVTYELEAINVLRGLLRLPKGGEALRAWYEEFRNRTSVRPRGLEAYHEGYNPRVARPAYGSWFGLVRSMGDMIAEAEACLEGPAGEFLRELEVTPMTKSFKMVVLLAMLNADCLPGEIEADKLVAGFARLVSRSARLREEVLAPLDDTKALLAYLEQNPIHAWTGGRGAEGRTYFSYDAGCFRTAFDVPHAARATFQELAREIVDWRLAEYLDRDQQPASSERFEGKVSSTNGRGIIFLPDRDKVPGIPQDWTPLQVDGEALEGNFVKVALNVVRQPGAEANQLPAILRRWFGADAGLPGTRFRVLFERDVERHFTMKPLGAPTETDGLELWRSYPREAIPSRLGFSIGPRQLQSGIVPGPHHLLLFVTLEKAEKPPEHRYDDRFLSPTSFQWQSQNQTTQGGKRGRQLRSPAEMGVEISLFVRKTSKVAGATASFVYCGQPEFVSWDGEKPITIQWRLPEPVPGFLREKLGVPDVE